jgi:hypothetical protein
VSNYITKSSGMHESFSTGSQRDAQEGKPRYDLIPLEPLKRLAELYARGSIKYGERNWEKGQPLSRYYASMFRHMMQWASGERDEDHIIAVAWNAFAIAWTEAQIEAGRLPEELADMPR